MEQGLGLAGRCSHSYFLHPQRNPSPVGPVLCCAAVWSVSTILTGLLSFMSDTHHTTGGLGRRVGGGLWVQLLVKERGGPGRWAGGHCTARCTARCAPLLRPPRCTVNALRPPSPPPSDPPSTAHPRCNFAGAISSSPQDKRRFAAESLAYNVRNPTFRKLFPEWVKKHEEAAAQQAQQAAAAVAQQQQPPQGQPAPGHQQQQPGAAAALGPGRQQPGGAGVGAGLAQQGQQPPQWSGYLVGAAAVAAAGVAATLLMKPGDVPQL